MKRVVFSIAAVLLLRGVSLPAETVYRRSMDRVASMDPADAAAIYASRAVQLVYETLLEFDYRARPYRLIPGLAAELPEVSPDGLSYTIQLRSDIAFQPHPAFGLDKRGEAQRRPMRSSDVIYSLKRLADRRLSSPGEWLVLDSIAGMRAFAEASMEGDRTDYELPLAGLEELDELRLRITLTRPMHQFVWFLAMSFTAVVPREVVEYYGSEFGSHAVGSGPYRLAQWRRNHRMSFERDPLWRGWSSGPAASAPEAQGRPFDKIVYVVIDDVSTQWLSFLAGELDFLGEISRDNWDVVIDGSGTLNHALVERGIALHSIPSLEVAYLGINMQDPLLGRNRPLRQALNCAFDGAGWTEFFNNRTIICDGPLPPGIEGRLETPFAYGYNLERAQELLCEAGFTNGIDAATGRRLELQVDVGRTSQDMRESMELLASFYERVGLTLKINYHNWPTFLRRVSNRQSQLFRIGWVGDYPDAENFLQLFYGRNVAPGPNRCNYVNPRFDELYEAACASADPEQRQCYWQEAQELVREDCPWVYLHFQKVYSLAHERVMDYLPSDFPYGTEKYLRVNPAD